MLLIGVTVKQKTGEQNTVKAFVYSEFCVFRKSPLGRGARRAWWVNTKIENETFQRIIE